MISQNAISGSVTIGVTMATMFEWLMSVTLAAGR